MNRYWLKIKHRSGRRITDFQHMYCVEAISRSEQSDALDWGEYVFFGEDIINDLAEYCQIQELDFMYGPVINGRKQPFVFDSAVQEFVPLQMQRKASPNLKYFRISNEKYEKQVETCAYCGATTVTIVKKGRKD